MPRKNRPHPIFLALYDEFTQVLDISFADGRSYTYHGVPQHVYDELVAAASQGSYFNANIRNSYS
jgi:lysyl-tRNA synthetase class 2